MTKRKLAKRPRMRAVKAWALVNDRGEIWPHFHDEDQPKIFAKLKDAQIDAEMATAWRIARVQITELPRKRHDRR